MHGATNLHIKEFINVIKVITVYDRTNRSINISVHDRMHDSRDLNLSWDPGIPKSQWDPSDRNCTEHTYLPHGNCNNLDLQHLQQLPMGKLKLLSIN